MTGIGYACPVKSGVVVVIGTLEPAHRAIATSSDRVRDRIAIELDVGVTLPRSLFHGLEIATLAQLAAIEIRSPGVESYWPTIGVTYDDVAMLLEGILGRRRRMAQNGRKGRSKKAAAKIATARSYVAGAADRDLPFRRPGRSRPDEGTANAADRCGDRGGSPSILRRGVVRGGRRNEAAARLLRARHRDLRINLRDHLRDCALNCSF